MLGLVMIWTELKILWLGAVSEPCFRINFSERTKWLGREANKTARDIVASIFSTRKITIPVPNDHLPGAHFLLKQKPLREFRKKLGIQNV
jgi:hypothetical protein